MTLLTFKAEGEGVVAFSEQQLLDAYEQVITALEPEVESVKARATHAIRRLREQLLLARVDAAGVRRPGEFALTRLATGIVDFHVGHESLTTENLTLLGRSLMLSLSEILNKARAAQSRETWQNEVQAPLKVTVQDLIAGIQARQRGLDLEQEQFQKRIADLLTADWFGAIEQCEEILDSTAHTLRELNEVLLGHTHGLSALLQDLLTLAVQSGFSECETAVAKVIEQVDRMSSWSMLRQRAFTEYYEYVQRYLRDIVRLDPSRALTQRLRKLLSDPATRNFSLSVAAAPKLGVLREVRAPVAPPPVRRKKKREESLPETQASAPDPDQLLEERLRALLDAGESDLSEMVRRLTEELAEDKRFVEAGRIAKVLARLRRPLSGGERPWVTVDDNLAIEQWQLAKVTEK
jgi:chromosome partition protein MukF